VIVDSQTPDGLLIAAALAGDESAFALLAQRYQPALLRAAISRLGRRELAEEAVQEALLCAHRWLQTYDSRFSCRTWLWTILLNQCTRQARREARHRLEEPQHPLLAEPGLRRNETQSGSPLDRLLARESADRLHALLADLPESQADALRLRFFGGLTFPEIAAAMACSEAGAKNRVKTGLIKLAQWLRAEESPHCRAERTMSASDGESLLGEKS
jgi:RNA polymerase sigma-70 factor (ECF subfamily)